MNPYLLLTSKHLHLVPDVDCEWNEWQVGECSVTCGDGSRTNSRTKKVKESDGTVEDGTCEGDETMVEDCNTQDCPRKFLRAGSEALVEFSE